MVNGQWPWSMCISLYSHLDWLSHWVCFSHEFTERKTRFSVNSGEKKMDVGPRLHNPSGGEKNRVEWVADA